MNLKGLFMEGARWDINIGSIVESRLKELHPIMPVMYIRAITQDKQASYISQFLKITELALLLLKSRYSIFFRLVKVIYIVIYM